MTSGTQTSGMANDLAQQASSKIRDIARWLESGSRPTCSRRPAASRAGAPAPSWPARPSRSCRRTADARHVDEARDDSGTPDATVARRDRAHRRTRRGPPPAPATPPVVGAPVTDPTLTPGTDPITGTGLGSPGTQSPTEGFGR